MRGVIILVSVPAPRRLRECDPHVDGILSQELYAKSYLLFSSPYHSPSGVTAASAIFVPRSPIAGRAASGLSKLEILEAFTAYDGESRREEKGSALWHLSYVDSIKLTGPRLVLLDRTSWKYRDRRFRHKETL